MRRLLILLTVLVPIGLVFAAAVEFGLIHGRDTLRVYDDYTGTTNWVWRVWAVALPGTLLASWAAMEVVCLIRRRPPRLLDTRVTMPIRRVITGVLIGVLSLAASITLAAYFADHAADAVLLAAAAFTVTFVVLMLWKRVRPLHCPRCNYDLKDSLSPTMLKCPECGMDGR